MSPSNAEILDVQDLLLEFGSPCESNALKPNSWAIHRIYAETDEYDRVAFRRHILIVASSSIQPNATVLNEAFRTSDVQGLENLYNATGEPENHSPAGLFLKIPVTHPILIEPCPK